MRITNANTLSKKKIIIINSKILILWENLTIV